MLRNQPHSFPCRGEHGIHVAALDVQFDIATTAEPVENAPLVRKCHRVRETRQHVAVEGADESICVVGIDHLRAGETEVAERAEEVAVDRRVVVFVQVGLQPLDRNVGEIVTCRRDALARWRENEREHPTLFAFRQVVG